MAREAYVATSVVHLRTSASGVRVTLAVVGVPPLGKREEKESLLLMRSSSVASSLAVSLGAVLLKTSEPR